MSENADRHTVTIFLAHALLAAQPVAAPPQAAVTPRRLIARFNFEESAQFNPGVPVDFYRVTSERSGDSPTETNQRDDRAFALGYPPFGTVATAAGVGREDERGRKGYAVCFTIDGASMVLGRDVELERVSAGASLMLRSWTHTEGLRNAAVRMSARFFDKAGNAVGGMHASELVRAETEWRMLEIAPPAVPAGAMLMQIWLEVVQPSMQAAAGDDRYEVSRSDIRGRAYFDDIELWQMPNVRFEPEAFGIVAPTGRARLHLACDDPMVRSAAAEVRVRDAAGHRVFETRLNLPTTDDRVIDLPQLETGWYQAEARFVDGPSEIATRIARVAVLPDDPFEPDQPPRFGASLGSLSMRTEPAVDLARSAFVVLPVWSEATELRDSAAEIEMLRPVVGRLLDRRVEPMFRIGSIPTRLAGTVRLDSHDALGLFSLDESRWRPALEPWLLAFGQRVDQWFIGSEPIDAGRPELAQRLTDIGRAMSKAIAGPAVTLPWSPETIVPKDLAAAVQQNRHVIEYVADAAWRESGAEAYEGIAAGPLGMVRIVPLPAGTVDEQQRAIDLALRAIDAWRAGFDAIAIDVRDEGTPSTPGPAIELAAWRQISTRLCGRRFVAEIPVAEGVRAILADGARGAALVLWNETGADALEVAVDLGPQRVLATDLWGRSREILPATGGHALAIGREPLFIEGISREMCLLRRGFRVDPAFAESKRAPQEGALVLVNPWEKPLSGTLTIVGPDALSISPRTHRFNIAAGAEARLPVSFSIPRSTEAGPVQVAVEVSGTADDSFRTRMSAPLEIGFRKAVIEPSWRLARSIESGAVDLVLTLKVTNVSQSPIDVEAFAGADGYASDRKLVTALAPGATAVRAFHFPDGARRLSGRDIRTGVHEAETDARLLKRVAIPPLLPPVADIANGADSIGTRSRP